MKSRRTRIAYGLAVAAAVVAVPFSAGSAAADSWRTIGGGPQVFSNMQECEEYAEQAKDRYKDTRCYETENGIYMDALV
ncbi:hypothetical protein [Streptomyces xiaopingdaonensis]|uniref:hypothetical protein n=1 Tax=Streptomyces xiaopingdaonensis TaxID=1565415 RepID=UPI000368F0AF|nr:hypothetical protein [Streptomyces xiaopingdaonensis]